MMKKLAAILVLGAVIFGGIFTGCSPSAVLQESALRNVGRPAPTAPKSGVVTVGDVSDTTAHTLVLTSFGQRASGALFTVTSEDCTSDWTLPVRQATNSLTSTFTLINNNTWTTCSFALYAWGTRDAEISLDSTRIAVWPLTYSAEPPDTIIPPPPDTITPPPPPDTGTVAPWIVEDFRTYTDIEHFITDPRGLYSAEYLPSLATLRTQSVIDLSTGVAGSDRSLRYDFRDRTNDGGTGTIGRCTSYTLGYNMDFRTVPGYVSPQKEIWVEIVYKTSSHWTNEAPAEWGCTSNSDYKFTFARVFGQDGRFTFILGNTYDNNVYSSVPYGSVDELAWQAYAGIKSTSATRRQAAVPFDGQWHTLRYHVKLNTDGTANGRIAVWFDGQRFRDDGVGAPGYTGPPLNITASDLYALALGRNLNQGPAQAQSLWWGRIAVWRTNPGW